MAPNSCRVSRAASTSRSRAQALRGRPKSKDAAKRSWASPVSSIPLPRSDGTWGQGITPGPSSAWPSAQDASSLRRRHRQRHREGDSLPSSGTILPPACGSALVHVPAEADAGEQGEHIAGVAEQVTSVHGLTSWDAIWISCTSSRSRRRRAGRAHSGRSGTGNERS